MVINFPLLRLPSLALDQVVSVMDPLEQLLLSRTSEKLKQPVERATKNHSLYFKRHRAFTWSIYGMRCEEKIVFGYKEKKSYLHVETVENLSEEQKNGRVFKKNGQATIYVDDSPVAIKSIYESVAKTFAAKTVVIDLYFRDTVPILELPGLNHFLLVFTSPIASVHQMITISSSKSKFSQTMSSGKYEYMYFEKDQSQRMTQSDLRFLSDLDCFVKIEALLDDYFWNNLLKDWIQRKITIFQLKISSELVTSGPEMFEGLNAKKVEEDEDYPKYQIERADGQKAMVYCADQVFHFNVC